MLQRMTAVFGTREAAERAAFALANLGADHEHISMLARGEQESVTDQNSALSTQEEREVTSSPPAYVRGDDFVEPAREVGDAGAPLTTSNEGDAARGAVSGAGIGMVVGLTAAAVALMVPGFGPVLAAGPLAWALGGAAGTAAAGAVAGGVYGGLRDVGIPDEHARHYEEHVRSGNVLLTALVPNEVQHEAKNVLSQHGAERVSFVDDSSLLSRTHAPDGTAFRRDLSESGPVDREAAVGSAAAATGPLGLTNPPYEAGGLRPTTGYNANVDRGVAKQAEGERHDRSADQTLSPADDMAAKAEKLKGRVQEEYGEEEENIEPRRA
jgi:uncharacterized membrane protein